MNSVLLVRLSAMGDLVHGLGAIAALHAARPELRLTLVTQPENVPLVQGLPALAEVLAFDRRGGLAAWRRLRAELRARDFDVALDLQGNWKSAFVAWLSPARDRVGAGAAWRQEPLSRWLLRRTVVVDRGPPHPAGIAHALAAELAPGLEWQAPELDATAAELTAERAELARRGIDPARPFCVVVVTDPRDPRALRPAAIAELARSNPIPVVRLLGPAEAALPAPEPAAGDLGAELRHGRGEIRRLVALGRLVAASGGEVVGPDQGATHVLAATGARCRVLFGSQDPARTAPIAATALVHPDPPDCSPCRSRRCRHPDGPVCMAFGPDGGREVEF
ncbi:MAG: glycosyltransferase family 9 protein [bacterium]|nr:glycosyltransferase family 9 protein [bacterium]